MHKTPSHWSDPSEPVVKRARYNLGIASTTEPRTSLNTSPMDRLRIRTVGVQTTPFGASRIKKK